MCGEKDSLGCEGADDGELLRCEEKRVRRKGRGKSRRKAQTIRKYKHTPIEEQLCEEKDSLGCYGEDEEGLL